jgi:hydrophobe/amphiphile efflux-1 (HAE1) family protein
MGLSRFFINRPIFAAVISIVIVLAGVLAITVLPVSEYPEVVPPTIQVLATYPGASPSVLGATVATPLEEQINGVDNMLYMASQAQSNGALTITVTFKIGTNPDIAQVQVQNRVAQALPRLPDEVRTLGVTTVKTSPDLMMAISLLSRDHRYDALYLRNYATLQVRDVINRVPGVGQVAIFGSGDYAMRVWLDPNRLADRGLMAGDVVRAIREQNVQVAAGVIGGQPVASPGAFQLTVNAHGRLTSEEEFGNIIVKVGAAGEVTRLRDVARLELGAGDYSVRNTLDNEPTVALAIFQAPGSNQLALAGAIERAMQDLKRDFPPGLDYQIAYNTTSFVQESISDVVRTLVIAIALVALVVVVFLQTWRASLIPLAAVPVSIVGTFAVMLAAGFSINTLSLFGLVLAVGIVVDDAIVVVENVERHIEEGLSPLAASHAAMNEVSGPIIAICLVLCAVFVPIAFISGLTGQFYRQFALTIAFSTVISAFNSLTLSPALAALLLKPRGATPDLLTRVIDRGAGWFFRPFNRGFTAAAARYRAGVARLIGRKGLALGAYAGLLALTLVAFKRVPSGFVPTQDKQYLVAVAQLPNGASLDRTDSVVHRMVAMGLATPGIEHAFGVTGLSINGFTSSANSGVIFFILKPFTERRTPALYGLTIAQSLNQQYGAIQGAFVGVFPPPSVNGLGQVGGFKLEIEDKGGVGDAALYQATQALLFKAYQTPGLAGLFSTFQINVPQLYVDVDREKAKRQGVDLGDLFETLQASLGSEYVNDFNRFGRTYQVVAQADAAHRASIADITQLKVRNAQGAMVPLGSVLTVRQSYGPDQVMHYNGFPSADINGGPAPGASSGQAQAAMARLASEVLPRGLSYDWTELAYQQILAGDSSLYVFPLCIVLAFLVLAAQYESWTLPLAVVLIVPMSLLSAVIGVLVTHGDSNVFTQVGLVVLVGLACKNAILLVEFAHDQQTQANANPVQAALEAARLRLRPILMTSVAFIMGVVPLVLATGAGAEMRHAMGVAVFSGMLGVSAFGLFLTPVFFVAIRSLAEQRTASVQRSHPIDPLPAGVIIAPAGDD